MRRSNFARPKTRTQPAPLRLGEYSYNYLPEQVVHHSLYSERLATGPLHGAMRSVIGARFDYLMIREQ
jgi:hypothetical protein